MSMRLMLIVDYVLNNLLVALLSQDCLSCLLSGSFVYSSRDGFVCGVASILILQKVVSPTVRWLLNAQLHNAESTSLFSGLLANFIIGSCYVSVIFGAFTVSIALDNDMYLQCICVFKSIYLR